MRRPMFTVKEDREAINLSLDSIMRRLASQEGDRPRYYDMNGDPISMMEWANMTEQGNQVALTKIKQNHRKRLKVSTIWLGMDNGWGDGPPVIFETMVFACRYPVRRKYFRRSDLGFPRSEIIDYQRRYCTLEQAKVGHLLTVEYFMYNRRQRRRYYLINRRTSRKNRAKQQ